MGSDDEEEEDDLDSEESFEEIHSSRQNLISDEHILIDEALNINVPIPPLLNQLQQLGHHFQAYSTESEKKLKIDLNRYKFFLNLLI